MWIYENKKGETVIERSLDEIFAEAENEVEATFRDIKGESRINTIFSYLLK